MKKLALVVVALIMNVTFVSAKDSDSKKSFDKTNEEFGALLKPISSVGELYNDVVVRVRVHVNQNNEIIVLDASTQNKELASYIKEKLNYKKLSTNELLADEDYYFNIKFKA
jgi:hypothetical protein